MKIGINALFLQSPTNGSGQYLLHLLDALARVDQKNEYVLFGPKQPVALPTGGTSQPAFPYQTKAVPALAARNENLEKVVWEQLTGPSAARKAGIDLFHIPHFAPPLIPRTPTIVTIHDVIPLRLPLYRGGARVEAYMRLVARAAQHNQTHPTHSQHARQDIIDALKIPADRIRVIYQAAGEEYRPITDAETLARVRARYNVGERYIFYLGGLDQRKNVTQLVRAFGLLSRQIGDPDLRLLIAGNPDKQRGPLFPDPRPVAAEYDVTDRVVYHFIEEEDKPAVYSGASVFVFPSLYEGFGLTPLEAMRCGAPVICSNRTSLPEVVGDAAISLDPDHTEALAQAMYQVLTEHALQADLRARSVQRAAQFSWLKTATETISAYEEAFARSKK